jgi:hypothetical protein
MTKTDKDNKAVQQQRKLFPFLNWAVFVCKCGYELVKNTGKKQ